MCLQCRFTDLYEYMCHITLIINKGMCQLPLGNQESRASRWVLRMWISMTVDALLLPVKGALTSPYNWGKPSSTSSIPTANIQRRANLINFSGEKRAQGEPFYCLVVHMNTAKSQMSHLQTHLYDKTNKSYPILKCIASHTEIDLGCFSHN